VPAFLPAGRGISPHMVRAQGDPSLRLKGGSAQEDDLNRSHQRQEFKLNHHPNLTALTACYSDDIVFIHYACMSSLPVQKFGPCPRVSQRRFVHGGF